MRFDSTPRVEVALTARQQAVLARINQPYTEIGEACGISKARVGQIMKRLETLGKIERTVWGWERKQ